MTQTRKIYQYLKTGNSLTQAQSVKYFGCYRLSARIWDLRKLGIEIRSEIVKQNGSYFAKYTLA